MNFNFYTLSQMQKLQFALTIMQNKMELLASYCNKLALQFSKKEYADNQISFAHGLFTQIKPPIINLLDTQIDVSTHYLSAFQLPTLLPSQLALEMVQMALKISSLLQTRFNLNDYLEKHNGMLNNIKKEQIFENPYIFGESEDKKSNNQKWQIQLQDCHDIIQNYQSLVQSISDRKSEDCQNKMKKLERKLAQQVTKICSRKKELSLNEFKIMAKRVYVGKSFRPSYSWCMSFLRRNGLRDYVAEQ